MTTQPLHHSTTQPLPKKWRRRLIVYGSLYLVFVLAMTLGGCVDRLIFHPSRDPVTPAGATRHLIPDGRGGSIELWSARTPACGPSPASPGSAGAEPRGFVLAFIGNADRAEYAVERTVRQWESHPVEVWAMNYPGFGGSSGGPSMKYSAAAALASYDAVREQAGDRPIYLSALSIGTAAALHVSANRPVAGLVLHNPPPLRQLILGRFGWWNLWLVAAPVAAAIPTELDSVSNARRTTAPAAFVLAGADEIVPPAYQRKVVDAYAGPKRLVDLPGATHNDMPDATRERNVRAAVEWLWDTAGAPVRSGQVP